MFPYIYQSDSITIGTYGVMLAIAYLVGRYLYIDRLNRNSDAPINSELLIIGLLVAGVVGAKLMFAFKNPDKASLFDFSSLLGGSGFSSQGAILGAILVTLLFSKLSKVKLSVLLDSAAFPAIVAYALARVGCFLAGDDCYGKPTDLPWAMSFPDGVAKTHELVHPVPLYEVLYSIAIALIIANFEKVKRPPYHTFFLLFVFWGASRFLVEFVANNPIKIIGMSGSQFGALIMFFIGAVFFVFKKSKH